MYYNPFVQMTSCKTDYSLHLIKKKNYCNLQASLVPHKGSKHYSVGGWSSREKIADLVSLNIITCIQDTINRLTSRKLINVFLSIQVRLMVLHKGIISL